MKIAITNHTGTRNRGCEALILSKILGFKSIDQSAQFEVMSHDPLYDSWRLKEHANVKYSYLTRTPDHFSSKRLNSLIYGIAKQIEKIPALSKRTNIAVQKSLVNADVVVPSGGDIFTSDYDNLRKHLSILIATPKHKKIYICGHTIGPLKRKDESYFKKVISRADIISVRESQSFDYLKSLNIEVPVHLTSDVAFTLPTLEKKDARALLTSKYGINANNDEFVALSISQGIIKYSNLDKNDYYQEFAKFVDYLNENGQICLLIPHVMETNPSNNDVIACEEVLKLVKQPNMNRIIFGEPSAVDFKGIIGISKCLVGTRTHSTIASLSQCIPTVSIAYSRKAYGIMQDVFGEKKGNDLTVDVRNMSLDKLIDSYELAVNTPPAAEKISGIKKLASQNFSLIDTLRR